MKTETIDTIIVGGGLSGIYAAWLLSRSNLSCLVLEARERIGGRILCPEHQGFHPDLGPSWYWPEIHPRMACLIQSLGLEGYPQFETGQGRIQRADGTARTVRTGPMAPQSWRLSGGMQALLTALAEGLPAGAVRCGHPVCEIEKTPYGVQVSVGELEKAPLARFTARRVILALPPRLAAGSILFTPELSHPLTQAMLKTGTWMAGQAKFSALYEKPFWREMGLSGQAFSERGPAGEVHDGSSRNGGPYGLTGFLGIPAAQRRTGDRLNEAILAQLAVLFGSEAARPMAFFYQDWAQERFTATMYDQPPMYAHPRYGAPAGKTSIWDAAVHFAGTETAPMSGGYLEGALEAAERAAAAALG